LITPPVGVPVIELFAQGDIGTNIETRRPDADSKADRFRRYEVAGAPHVDSWEELSFASKADMLRATGDSVASQDNCRPADVAPSDFPNRHAFNAAWQNLDLWVRRGIAPPRAPLLSLKPRAPGQPFDPASAFVEDASGNAMGGVRTPAIDVPTARWVGAKTGAFRCLFEGYKIPFDDAKLRSLYPDHAAYLAQVKRSAAALERERWLTAADAREIVQEAEREPARVYSEATLATHTIYRPAKLTGRYPVVLWGNGSCVNSSFHYREFLAQIASQGFIVLAIGPYRDSAPPRQQRPENPAEWPPFETRSSQMLDALDWITAENARRDSPFYGKVDSNKVAAMGHSCGGLQTIKVSTDPRITTAVVLNSGMITDDDQYMIRHDVKRSILSQMHAPIAYFIGGEKDIAYANAETDWKELQRLRIPAINANMDVGHGATYDQPNGGPFASGPLAWLQWRLKGDERARAQFVGERCGFCDGKAWRLRRHLIE
jgi:dienelactone hydrolase